MIILNTLTILIQFGLIVFLSFISMNFIRYFTSATRRMAVVGPALFVNHGGGPLPLLGDPDHAGITKFLREDVQEHVNFKEIKAIILVTAHWEEDEVTVSSNLHHSLYFDYYGFPPESYKYRYDAYGYPELAERIHNTLNEAGIKTRLDPERGWDHGVFVPMMLLNPAADIPIVQLSVLANQDPAQHYKLGETLQKFRQEGIAIIGSGMSYHNMREFRSGSYGEKKVVNKPFDDFLTKVCTSKNDERKSGLLSWREQPGANEAHPPRAAEHFMPLIVVAGAGGSQPGEKLMSTDLSGKFRLSCFIWKYL